MSDGSQTAAEPSGTTRRSRPSTPRTRSRRAAWALAIVTSAAIAVLAFSRCVDGAFRPNWDGGTYLELARSLAAGEGYAYQGVPHTKFPPAYPALVAAALRAGTWLGEAGLRPDRGLATVQAAHGALLGAGFVAIGALAAHRRRPLVFVAGAAAVALGPVFVRQVSQVGAEPLAFALQGSCLAAAAAWGADSGWRRHARAPAGPAVAFALFALAAVLTRTAGVAVVLAGWLHVWLRGGSTLRARTIGCVAAGALPAAGLAAWFVWGATRGTPPLPAELFETRGYGRWFLTPSDDYTARMDRADLLPRAADLAVRYFRAAVRLASFESPPVHWPAVAIVAAGLVASAARAARRMRDPVGLAILATTAVYVAYTWGGDRFLLPVLPLLAGLGAEAVHSAVHRVARRVVPRPGADARVAAACALGAVGLLVLPFGVRRWLRTADQDREVAALGGPRPELFAACEWLRVHAAPGDVVVSDEAASVAWLTGLRTWSYPLVRDGDTISDAIRDVGARWLLHVEGREWNGRPRLPRDLAEGTRGGTSVAWSGGRARIVRLRD